MKPAPIIQLDQLSDRRAHEQGSVRVVLLALVCFCVGFAVSAILIHRGAKPAATPDQGPQLSDSTKAVLEHLNAPVEVRFYSLLDSSAPAPLSAFSSTVDSLLSAYQQQANGKLEVKRYNSQANSGGNAALADGIRAFNLDKGDGCFLGVAMSSKGKKETLAQLSPEWGAALESDLSRAIVRLTEEGPSIGKATTTAPGTDAAIIDEVKRAIPNIATVSLEDGTRILRETALKDFTAAVSEMQAQVQEAQHRLEQLQNGGSAGEQESAMKHLQEVQAAQAERLRQIAAKSQAQIAALQQIKASGK